MVNERVQIVAWIKEARQEVCTFLQRTGDHSR